MTANGPTQTRSIGYASGVAMILLAGVLWSTMGLGVRLIENASAIQILFYRSIGLLPVLLLFIAVRGGGNPMRLFARTGPASIIGGVFLVIAFCGGIISLTETTVANAVLLFSVSPLFASLLAFFVLGERIRLATWITMLVAGVGVFIMVIDGISLGKLYGNLAAISSAAGFAVFTLCLRWEKAGDSTPGILLGGLYATIATGVAIPIAGQSYAISLPDMGIALAMGAVGLSGGLICYSIATRTVPAGEASLLSLLEVVLAPIWVFLLVGEGAGFNTLVGGGLLLLALFGNAISGLISQRREQRRLSAVAAADDFDEDYAGGDDGFYEQEFEPEAADPPPRSRPQPAARAAVRPPRLQRT